MAETVRKKAAKKASGKKRGRPRKTPSVDDVYTKEEQRQMIAAVNRLAEYSDGTVAKKRPGRPRTNPGERLNVIDAQDAPDTIETNTPASRRTTQREKNAFERNFGEGTAFDLDYGKLLIIALCIYIAVQVS